MVGQLFDQDYTFTDHTGMTAWMEPHSFPSVYAALLNAGMSRLFGGIHYRNAIESGLVHDHVVESVAPHPA